MSLPSSFARFAIPGLLLICHAPLFAQSAYPPAEERRQSSGDTRYFIDPVHGDDAATGTRIDQPWRTFLPLNQWKLGPGDRVEVVRPGRLDHTLSLAGRGTAPRPIQVRFAPGKYDFHPQLAHRHPWQISNTNADPDTPKAVAIHIADAAHIHLAGRGAVLHQRGKAIHVCIERAGNVRIDGMAFDYHRPTVSEFTITHAGADFADLEIHPDSAYTIEDGAMVWQGEGWSERGGLTQNFDPATGRVFRQPRLFQGLRFEELAPFRVRAHGKHRFQTGRIYQDRNPFRDCAGVFTQHSRDIVWRDVHFRFIHGMGVINQFSENLTFDGVVFAPAAGSGRSTAAWADCIQASGCRGNVIIRNCTFQGAHDDAINIHGTHLRVVGSDPATRSVMVRFMHDQTFGFEAFFAGDEIEFVRWDSLETYAPNRVVRTELVDPHHMTLVLDHDLPENLAENDVVENVTWTPSAHISGNVVRHIPTRGFLVTTRRPVVIEDNDFHATHMPGILIENDASGWFESGAVRDMRIRNNRFYHCGQAAIRIHPRHSVPNPAVHENIRIEGNEIHVRHGAAAVIATGVSGLHVTKNTIFPFSDHPWLKLDDCGEFTGDANLVLDAD